MPRSDSRALRILVADDNRDQALTLVALLRADGHEARAVYDGHAALELASTFEPDVYLLDIGMPVMNGYELARALRERYGHRPLLIAVSAYAQAADRIAAELAGFDHHLAKPFAVERLIALLKGRTLT